MSSGVLWSWVRCGVVCCLLDAAHSGVQCGSAVRRAALQITQPSLSAWPKRSSQDEKAQSNKLRGDSGVLCQGESGWEGRTTRTTRTSRTSR